MATFSFANQTTRREEDVNRRCRRILACILPGNNDAHSKNFGLLCNENGFRPAPFYDVVAAALGAGLQTACPGGP
jgi:serine/threonine protein kinase HipA of HipAB toxin-antitoxin module